MKSIFSTVLVAGLALLGCGASASAAQFSWPTVDASSVHVLNYVCSEGVRFQVEYGNSDSGQSFALLPIQGQTWLLVETLAGSGVKYQAGPYTWWTKGKHADLYDARAAQSWPPALSNCMASD
jgi:membrane-bound inhibitor of C-type lysozyme